MTNSTVDDKVKLKHVLKLLKQKINYKRVMGEDNLSQLCRWVNAAYGVHPYLKSHNGGGMSFGYRLMICKFIKHKSNTKSSTEAEVLVVSNYLTYNIWICLFMEAQGYENEQNMTTRVR